MSRKHQGGNAVLASLGAFARAGIYPSTPLQKAVVAALCLKLVAVLMMRIFLSWGDARVAVDDRVLETRIVGQAPYTPSLQ